MKITDGGLSFEISVDSSNQDIPVEENATNLLRGKGRVHTTLNNINKLESENFIKFVLIKMEYDTLVCNNIIGFCSI